MQNKTPAEALAQAMTEAATDRPGIHAEAEAVLHELDRQGWELRRVWCTYRLMQTYPCEELAGHEGPHRANVSAPREPWEKRR